MDRSMRVLVRPEEKAASHKGGGGYLSMREAAIELSIRK